MKIMYTLSYSPYIICCVEAETDELAERATLERDLIQVKADYTITLCAFIII